MIVDTHVHAVEPPSAERPHDPDAPHAGTILAEDLLKAARAAGVDKIVHVVPSLMVWDNSYGFEIAEKYPDQIVGIITRADPFHPGVEQNLRALHANPKMLGVRFTLSSAKTATWLPERKLDPAFAAAEKIGTAVQLFAPFQVEQTQATVRRFPKLRFLIDHMALRHYEGRDNTKTYRDWPQLLELAKEPNVWIKCSYFPEASQEIEKYPYPKAQSYFKQLYESTDPSHLIWGSNFPPVEEVCGYKQAVDFVMKECSFLKPADREAITSGNFLKYFAR